MRSILFIKDGNKYEIGRNVVNSAALELDASLDISVVEKLHESLNELTHSVDMVHIDAGKVERLDTAALQLLFSYQQSMDKKHISLEIVNPSKAFMDNATLLGMHQILNVKH